LIAYFIGNVSAKKYQNPFTCVKVIASQRWDVFETRCKSVHGSKMVWSLKPQFSNLQKSNVSQMCDYSNCLWPISNWF